MSRVIALIWLAALLVAINMQDRTIRFELKHFLYLRSLLYGAPHQATHSYCQRRSQDRNIRHRLYKCQTNIFAGTELNDPCAFNTKSYRYEIVLQCTMMSSIELPTLRDVIAR